MQDYSSAYSQAGVATDRSGFIVKTYLHLLGAIMAFVALEVVIFASGLALPMAQAIMYTSWLLVLGGFMMVSWIGSRVARRPQVPPCCGFDIASITWSRLKLPGFCRGGNSRKLCSHWPT